MITEDDEDSNKKSVKKTHAEDFNGPSNIRAGALKKTYFNVQVWTQGSVEEGIIRNIVLSYKFERRGVSNKALLPYKSVRMGEMKKDFYPKILFLQEHRTRFLL